MKQIEREAFMKELRGDADKAIALAKSIRLERVATAALQGILSHYGIEGSNQYQIAEETSKLAVKCAIALMCELRKVEGIENL